MSGSNDTQVIIVGGGIAGLATAVALLRRGIQCAIYEKASSFKPVGAAIGLFPNGFQALGAISQAVCDRIRTESVPQLRNVMRNLDGSVIRDSDMTKLPAGGVSPVLCVWYLLQRYLLEELPEGTVRFGHTFESYLVDEETGSVSVRFLSRETGDTVDTTCRVLVGADGIRSAVRTSMLGEERALTYHGKMMFRSVLNANDIDESVCKLPPAGTAIAYQGDEPGKLFAFRETAGGIFTFTAMARFDEPKLLNKESERQQRLKELFASYPSDVGHLVDIVSPSAIHEDAVYDIDVEQRWSTGPVVIIGDAAHAMTPGMGQGANQGLEDACELAYALSTSILGEGNDDDCNEKKYSIDDALESFYRRRVSRVKEIHAQSRENTMRVNRSSKSTPVSLGERKDDTFNDRLYGWKPSFVQVESA